MIVATRASFLSCPASATDSSLERRVLVTSALLGVLSGVDLGAIDDRAGEGK